MKAAAKPKAKLPRDLRATLAELQRELELRLEERDLHVELMRLRRSVRKIEARLEELREREERMPSARRGP